jgi:group I intron endonuclease
MFTLYAVQNKVTDKIYFGQTTQNLERYWNYNVNAAMCGKDSKPLLYRAIRKYGANAFTVTVVGQADTKDQLDNWEKLAILVYGTQNTELGYNITAGGEGVLGYKPSDEEREANRQRAIARGVPKGFREGGKKYLENREFSEEYRNNLSKASKGKPKSEEHKQALSEARKKMLASRPDVIEGLKKRAAARRASDETKAKMRAAQAARRRKERAGELIYECNTT